MTHLRNITLSGIKDAAPLTVVFEDSDRTSLVTLHNTQTLHGFTASKTVFVHEKQRQSFMLKFRRTKYVPPFKLAPLSN